MYLNIVWLTLSHLTGASHPVEGFGSSIQLELGDNRRVVRRFLPTTGFSVDKHARRFFSERLRNPDVIDAQTQIAAKGARAVVPPRELFVALIMNSKRVDKTPLLDTSQGFLLRLAKKNSPSPQHRTVDVAVLGRNVEVTAQQNALARPITRIEEGSQTLQPFELEIVFLRSHSLSVWNVD